MQRFEDRFRDGFFRRGIQQKRQGGQQATPRGMHHLLVHLVGVHVADDGGRSHRQLPLAAETLAVRIAQLPGAAFSLNDAMQRFDDV